MIPKVRIKDYLSKEVEKLKMEESILDRFERVKRLLIQELKWNYETLILGYAVKLGDLRTTKALSEDPKELPDDIEIGIPEIGRYAPLKDEVLSYCLEQGFLSPYIKIFDEETKRMLIDLLRLIRIRNGLLIAIQSSPELFRYIKVTYKEKTYNVRVKYLGVIPLINESIRKLLKELLDRLEHPIREGVEVG